MENALPDAAHDTPMHLMWVLTLFKPQEKCTLKLYNIHTIVYSPSVGITAGRPSASVAEQVSVIQLMRSGVR